MSPSTPRPFLALQILPSSAIRTTFMIIHGYPLQRDSAYPWSTFVSAVSFYTIPFGRSLNQPAPPASSLNHPIVLTPFLNTTSLHFPLPPATPEDITPELPRKRTEQVVSLSALPLPPHRPPPGSPFVVPLTPLRMFSPLRGLSVPFGSVSSSSAYDFSHQVPAIHHALRGSYQGVGRVMDGGREIYNGNQAFEEDWYRADRGLAGPGDCVLPRRRYSRRWQELWTRSTEVDTGGDCGDGARG
ncbi:hypothetical protein B0H16DRAFT_1738449 [Mycena metata]|uniref:Uncharacterized protein n=1 Tax=Mycena metata TaxID=1033252 RepID=A0AAD7HHV8_9AGAR|nr:hypothetical protein B0H16DRAFT_1738449 [Mycena metata]